MSLRWVLLLVTLLALAMTPRRAHATTPTEALAFRQAALNRTAYTLPPEKLKVAQELFRRRTALHFAGEGWGDFATRAAACARRSRTDAGCCGEFDDEPMEAMLRLCVSASAGDYAAGYSAEGLWTPRSARVWAVGAGVGELGLGPDEEFSADLGCRLVCW